MGDGKTGAYIQDQDHPGCYARYRFHEKRQDFSVVRSFPFSPGRQLRGGEDRLLSLHGLRARGDRREEHG